MARIKDVKLTFSKKSPHLPPIKVEVDGEAWTNITEIGWKAKWGDSCLVTLSFTANLEIDYVD